jgi:glycosyltransferase involved in cell wall biosynthesis
MMIGPFPRSPESIDGGAASALTYLSQELASRPDVELVGIRIADSTTVSRGEGRFTWPIHDLPLGRLGLPTLYRSQRKYLGRLLREYRPDIVHAQGIDLPGFVAVKSGFPSVVTVHGVLGEETKFGVDARARARSFLTEILMERPTVTHAKDLISISPYVTQHYGRRITGRVHEIPNPISQRYFEVKREPQRGRLLFAGRIIKRKGVIDLVRAFAQVRQTNATVVLAGASTEPDYEQLVRQEISRQRLSAQFEFRGLLDESAVLSEFSRAEALVLPSYQETAPMVIQQAMAAGLPVIASRICGIPYQIQHEMTGLLYTAGSTSELALLMRRLWTEPQLGPSLAAAARESAIRNYHAASVADATIVSYKIILGVCATQ